MTGEPALPPQEQELFATPRAALAWYGRTIDRLSGVPSTTCMEHVDGGPGSARPEQLAVAGWIGGCLPEDETERAVLLAWAQWKERRPGPGEVSFGTWAAIELGYRGAYREANAARDVIGPLIRDARLALIDAGLVRGWHGRRDRVGLEGNRPDAGHQRELGPIVGTRGHARLPARGARLGVPGGAPRLGGG